MDDIKYFVRNGELYPYIVDNNSCIGSDMENNMFTAENEDCPEEEETGVSNLMGSIETI